MAQSTRPPLLVGCPRAHHVYRNGHASSGRRKNGTSNPVRKHSVSGRKNEVSENRRTGVPNFEHKPCAQSVTVRRKSLRRAFLRVANGPAGRLLADRIAIAMRERQDGEQRRRVRCSGRCRGENPARGNVGSVARLGRERKEMAVGAWYRFVSLERAFYCQKGASKRLNEVCNAPFLQQINELRWPDPNRELVDDARFQIVAARPGAGSRRAA